MVVICIACGQKTESLSNKSSSQIDQIIYGCCSQAEICRTCFENLRTSGQTCIQEIRHVHSQLSKRGSPVADVMILLNPELFEVENSDLIEFDPEPVESILLVVFTLLESNTKPSFDVHLRVIDAVGDCTSIDLSIEIRLLLVEALMEGVPHEDNNLQKENTESMMKMAVKGMGLCQQAFQLAKDRQRTSEYYNISLALWRIIGLQMLCNPTQFLPVLMSVSSALEEINDAQTEWRLFLLTTILRINLDLKKPPSLVNAGSRPNSASSVTSNNVAPNPAGDNQPLAPALAAYFKQIAEKAFFLCSNSMIKERVEVLYLYNRLLQEHNQKIAAIDKWVDKEPLWQGFFALQKMKSNAAPKKQIPDLDRFLKNFMSIEDPWNMDSEERKHRAILRQTVLIDIGNCTVAAGQTDLAIQVANHLHTAINNSLGAKIKYFIADLIALKTKLSPSGFQKDQLQHLLSVLMKLKEGLLQASLSENSDVIEEGCVKIWNYLLPLLQRFSHEDLQNKVTDLLQKVSESLTDINSSLLILRSRVHTELAKIYELDHLYGKALYHIDHAAVLVPTIAESFKKEQIEPIRYRLKIKLNPFTQALPEDKAIFMIEQSALTENQEMARYLLQQALQVVIPLYTAESHFDIDWAIKKLSVWNISEEASSNIARQRMCFEHLVNIMTMAKRHQCWDIVFVSSSIMVKQNWTLEKTAFINKWIFEAYILRAGSQVFLYHDEDDPEEPVDEDSETPGLSKRVSEICAAYFEAIQCAQQVTNELVRASLVLNGVSFIYNYFLSLMETTKLEYWAAVFRKCYESLLPFKEKSGDVFLIISEIRCRCVLDMIRGEGKQQRRSAKNESGNDLKAAEDVCKTALALSTENFQVQTALIEVYYQILSQKSSQISVLDAKGDAQLISEIEFLERSSHSNRDKDTQLASKSLDKLVAAPMIASLKSSLATRLMKVLIDLEQYALAIKCSNSIKNVIGNLDNLKHQWVFAYYTGEAWAAFAKIAKDPTEVTQRSKTAFDLFEKALSLCKDDYSKTLNISKKLFNVAQNLYTRMPMTAQLEKCIKLLFELIRTHQPKFAAKETQENHDVVFGLLDMFCFSLHASQNYSIVFQYLDKAFELLPEDYHRRIWKMKIFFLSKSGKRQLDVFKFINSLGKDSTAIADTWHELGLRYNDLDLKNSAFNKAINVADYDSPIKSALIMMDYSTFLLYKKGTFSEASSLINKVDVLLEKCTNGTLDELFATLKHRTIKTLLNPSYSRKRSLLSECTDIADQIIKMFLKCDSTSQITAPKNATEWAAFSFPSDLKNKMKADACIKSADMQVLERPGDLVLVLLILARQLLDLSLKEESLPVLHLIELFSAEFVQSAELTVSVANLLCLLITQLGYVREALTKAKMSTSLPVKMPLISDDFRKKETILLSEVWALQLNLLMEQNDFSLAEQLSRKILRMGRAVGDWQHLPDNIVFLAEIIVVLKTPEQALALISEKTSNAALSTSVWGTFVEKLLEQTRSRHLNETLKLVLSKIKSRFSNIPINDSAHFDAQKLAACLSRYTGYSLVDSSSNVNFESVYKKCSKHFEEAQSLLAALECPVSSLLHHIEIARFWYEQSLLIPADVENFLLQGMDELKKADKYVLTLSEKKQYQNLVMRAHLLELQIQTAIAKQEAVRHQRIKNPKPMKEKIHDFVSGFGEFDVQKWNDISEKLPHVFSKVAEMVLNEKHPLPTSTKMHVALILAEFLKIADTKADIWDLSEYKSLLHGKFKTFMSAALNSAFATGNYGLIEKCTSHVMELAPPNSKELCKSLMILQACGARRSFVKTMKRHLQEGSPVKSTWNELEFLHQKLPPSAGDDISILQKHDQLIQKSSIWKKISFDQSAFNAFAQLPSNMKIVLLNHSPDKRMLYACVITKKQSAAAAAAKTKAPASNTAAAGTVSETDLDALISFQITSMETDMQKLASLKQIYADSGYEASSIRQELMSYLQPVLKQFVDATEVSRVATPAVAAKNAKNAKEKEKKTEDDSKHYVFIYDEEFNYLPIKSIFKFGDAKSMTKDLSVPTLLQRLVSQSATTPAPTGKGAAPPAGYFIGKEAMAYIVLGTIHGQIIQTVAQKSAETNPFMSKWLGIYEKDTIPSGLFMKQLSFNFGIFLYIGNSFMNHISKISDFSAKKCGVVIICEDKKTKEEQQRKADLLSLFGVRTVIFAPIDDAKIVFQTLADVMAAGKSIAELITPPPSTDPTASLGQHRSVQYVTFGPLDAQFI